MSEIKANKISPAFGTDVTMGDSGDTFTIPAGATIVNSGTATGFGGITKSASDPAVDTNPAGGVGTVWANTTSGEMFILTDATAGANVWTNIGDGTGKVAPPYMSATGGTITTDGNFKVHTFTTSGTFTPTLGIDVTVGDKVEYLVIAGGGKGSYGGRGGGGGAGGYRTASGFSLLEQAYTVTVGAGASTRQGGDSIFSSITSSGGGGAGKLAAEGWNQAYAGGSGGGAFTGGTAGAGNTPSTSPSQGNAGGLGYDGGAGNQQGGGGGGAGAVGGAAASLNGGNGGAGLSSSITGTAIFRGGGGAGYTYGAANTAIGGNGGGGNGAYAAGGGGDGTAGSVNTGGGGGAGSTANGLNGGSGVVIIRYQFQ